MSGEWRTEEDGRGSRLTAAGPVNSYLSRCKVSVQNCGSVIIKKGMFVHGRREGCFWTKAIRQAELRRQICKWSWGNWRPSVTLAACRGWERCCSAEPMSQKVGGLAGPLCPNSEFGASNLDCVLDQIHVSSNVGWDLNVTDGPNWNEIHPSQNAWGGSRMRVQNLKVPRSPQRLIRGPSYP